LRPRARARPLPSPAKAPAPAHTEENADEPSDLSSPPPSSPPQRKAAPTASRKRAAPTRDSSPDPEAAKENTIVEPEGRSRRGAAVRAEDKLKDAMQDANSFALQKRRGASVVAAPWEKNGGKRAGTTAADGATKGKKRAGTHESDEEEAEEGSQRPAKKAKVAPASKRNTKAESMDEEDVGQDEAIDGEDEFVVMLSSCLRRADLAILCYRKVQPKVLITMAVIPDTTMTVRLLPDHSPVFGCIDHALGIQTAGRGRPDQGDRGHDPPGYYGCQEIRQGASRHSQSPFHGI
jgi:hypothetical protein